MTGYDEPLMQLEASRYSARFIKKPIKSPSSSRPFGAASRQCGVSGAGRGKRVLGGFRVTVAGRPAAVVDVSYGGLCLKIPAADAVPALLDVEVSGLNLHLVVEPVWSSANMADALLCGAALASDSTPAARTWREIVDRLSA